MTLDERGRIIELLDDTGFPVANVLSVDLWEASLQLAAHGGQIVVYVSGDEWIGFDVVPDVD